MRKISLWFQVKKNLKGHKSLWEQIRSRAEIMPAEYADKFLLALLVYIRYGIDTTIATNYGEVLERTIDEYQSRIDEDYEEDI